MLNGHMDVLYVLVNAHMEVLCELVNGLLEVLCVGECTHGVTV